MCTFQKPASQLYSWHKTDIMKETQVLLSSTSMFYFWHGSYWGGGESVSMGQSADAILSRPAVSSSALIVNLVGRTS